MLLVLLFMLWSMPYAKAQSFIVGYMLGSSSSSKVFKTAGGSEFIKTCELKVSGFADKQCDCSNPSLVNVGAIMRIYEFQGITHISYGSGISACLPIKLSDLMKEVEKSKPQGEK